MQELEQGEEYDELDVEDTDLGDEGSEDTNAGFDTIFGIPKKVFIIGAGAVVVVILAIVLFILWRNNSDESASSGNAVFDGTGYEIGSITGTDDGSSVVDAYGSVVGTIDSISGTTPLFNEDMELVGMMLPMSAGVVDDSGVSVDLYESTDDTYYEGDVSTDYYSGDITDLSSDETTKELRKLGYTGDEIELARQMGIPTENLIEAANAVQEERTRELLLEMSNADGDMFNTIYTNSIFFMPQYQFNVMDPNDSRSRNYSASYLVNADYTKVPTYGCQLFLKCKIANDLYVFYNVTPEQWERLPDEGNIVLAIEYYIYGTNPVNMYVTKVIEQNVATYTVNAVDSSVDISDIISDGSYDDYLPSDDYYE